MEIKRATELSICALLAQKLPDLQFFASKGGGNDVTPVWQPNHAYQIGDILHPSDPAMTYVVVVTTEGISGGTEPAFDNVPGSEIKGPPDYLTTSELEVSVALNSTEPIPPFAVVMCEPSERTLTQEDTGIMHGTLAWVTRQSQTDIITHSQNFKRIYDALSKIGSGYDILRRITIHGLDISGTDDFTDPEKEAHGDTIGFVVGVTAKPFQV